MDIDRMMYLYYKLDGLSYQSVKIAERLEVVPIVGKEILEVNDIKEHCVFSTIYLTSYTDKGQLIETTQFDLPYGKEKSLDITIGYLNELELDYTISPKV